MPLKTQLPKLKSSLILIALSGSIISCSPTIKVEAPDKPITINLNIKIEHEIRIKVDKELDSLISEDNGLF